VRQRERAILFGGDGTFDLLTNTYTPRFFYNHLDREIALATRAINQSRIYPISLIAFRLPLNVKLTGEGALGKNNKEKIQLEPHFTPYEKALINIGKRLEKTMREGDVIARIYESGFVISTRNQLSGTEAMKSRIEKLLPREVETFVIEWRSGESRHSLIARLDEHYFPAANIVDNENQ